MRADWEIEVGTPPCNAHPRAPQPRWAGGCSAKSILSDDQDSEQIQKRMINPESLAISDQKQTRSFAIITERRLYRWDDDDPADGPTASMRAVLEIMIFIIIHAATMCEQVKHNLYMMNGS